MSYQRFYIGVLMSCIAGVSLPQLYAQDEHAQTFNFQQSGADDLSESNTTMYVELGGKLWYSVNVDYRKDSSTAMSAGVQYIEDAFIPSVMYFYLYGESASTEVGGGVSGIFDRSKGLEGIAIHGVYGYRYQKKNGLLFRIGFMPFIGIPLTSTGKFAIVPWGGISIGYSL